MRIFFNQLYMVFSVLVILRKYFVEQILDFSLYKQPTTSWDHMTNLLGTYNEGKLLGFSITC